MMTGSEMLGNSLVTLPWSRQMAARVPMPADLWPTLDDPLLSRKGSLTLPETRHSSEYRRAPTCNAR